MIILEKTFDNLATAIVVTLCVYLSSCTNGKEEVSLLQQRIDSLEKVDKERQNDLKDLTGFITTLSDGLDSIAVQENMLFSNKGIEGIYVDRKQLKLNLEMFEEKLIQQKRRINQLSDSLKSKGAKIEVLNNLVQHLNLQLDEKNKKIQSLKNELEKKNVNLALLRTKVNSLSESNAILSEKAEHQMQALKTQDEMINECYVKIGSKKELIAGGYATGGFLKKTKVNHNSLQKQNFTAVDIRNFKEVTVNSTSPKILTQMPVSSYRWVKNGNSTSTLQITDPTSFWSISNFLIIQIN